MEIIDELTEAVEFLKEKGVGRIDCSIILGTGLGALASRIKPILALNYSQIPHLPIATVEFHFGKLIYGELEGKRVLAWQGRFHYYEGYSMEQIVKPVRMAKMLGAKAMIISNASGSLNPEFKKGQLMSIEDHINLQPEGPLRGQNIESLGVRFPDMSNPYHTGLRRVLAESAQQLDLTLQHGVYASVPGPHLETRAEYRYLRLIGADAVGMSTVPEVIACAHMGLPCCAISVLTDECNPEALERVNIESILAVAKESEPDLTELIVALVRRLDEGLGMV
jgi:purine-nucleoside phosphorylase